MPVGLVDLGGGMSTYNTDVKTNQHRVGISVYDHPNKNRLYSPFPPNHLPTLHNRNDINTAAMVTDIDVFIKCRVRVNGLNAGAFTNALIAKYNDNIKPIGSNSPSDPSL